MTEPKQQESTSDGRSYALLPIFDGVQFKPEDHKVHSWFRYPGAEGFPGLDNLGWGTSPNGIVTCINIPMCSRFNAESSRDWSTLWSLEATADEVLMEAKNPVRAHYLFLKRLIVPVRVGDLKFIPDSEMWEVGVPLDLSPETVRQGVSGGLVLRPTLSEKVLNAQQSTFIPRKPWPAFKAAPTSPLESPAKEWLTTGIQRDLKATDPCKERVPDDRSERVKKLTDKSTRPASADWTIDAVKVGQGSKNLVFTDDGLESNIPLPSNPGVEFNPGGATIRTGGRTLDTDAPIDRTSFDGMIFNPRAKFMPPNLVDYYPLTLTVPVKWIWVTKAILGPIHKLVATMQGYETDAPRNTGSEG